MNPDTDTIRLHVTDEHEVAITMPDGRVAFVSFWAGVLFAWRAIFAGRRVEVDEP